MSCLSLIIEKQQIWAPVRRAFPSQGLWHGNVCDVAGAAFTYIMMMCLPWKYAYKVSIAGYDRHPMGS